MRQSADEARSIAMGSGSVAVVDALGFKEARRYYVLEDLVASIKAAQSGATHQASMTGLFGGARTTIAAFSDSLILANLTQSDDWSVSRRREVKLTDTIYNVASCVGYVMVKAARAAAPLAYRGCIATGDIWANDSIFVGQAIDDAAELSSAALAAVTWLAPGARKLVEADSDRSQMAYVQWELPLRDRGSVEVLVVNPFYHESIERLEDDLTEDQLKSIETALLVPLGKSDRMDVVQKLQNTAAFLRAARHHTLDSFPKMQSDYYDSRAEDEDGHA